LFLSCPSSVRGQKIECQLNLYFLAVDRIAWLTEELNNSQFVYRPENMEEYLMIRCKVAVVGATGAVGKEILNILAARKFPALEVVALASARSTKSVVMYGDTILPVRDLAEYDFRGTDICLSAPGASVSKEFAPRAAAAGCIVIDKSSQFRMDPDVPLVVPEVNPHDLAWHSRRNIISSPNCTTIQMVVALKPLHDIGTIRRIVISSYQAVSGAGKEAMMELDQQARAHCAEETPQCEVFRKQIAFNLIPQIEEFSDDEYTKEELKLTHETHRILDARIKVSATCVRVPVFNCHGESVNVEFERPVSPEAARAALSVAPGVALVDDPREGVFATPIECSGRDEVFVSRVRRDRSVENGLNLWLVSDNLRKGAALNAVQIAEIVARDYLVRAT
jgi:aspartate-semialdehyde dehydrogenase